MDLDGLSRFFPLGGASVLFMLLLGWIMNERANFVTERKAERDAHADELKRVREDAQTDIDRVRGNFTHELEQKDSRIDELEEENKELRAERRGNR